MSVEFFTKYYNDATWFSNNKTALRNRLFKRENELDRVNRLQIELSNEIKAMRNILSQQSLVSFKS